MSLKNLHQNISLFSFSYWEIVVEPLGTEKNLKTTARYRYFYNTLWICIKSSKYPYLPNLIIFSLMVILMVGVLLIAGLLCIHIGTGGLRRLSNMMFRFVFRTVVEFYNEKLSILQRLFCILISICFFCCINQWLKTKYKLLNFFVCFFSLCRNVQKRRCSLASSFFKLLQISNKGFGHLVFSFGSPNDVTK